MATTKVEKCVKCGQKGFVHENDTNAHHTAANIACYFCVTCPACHGKKEIVTVIPAPEAAKKPEEKKQEPNHECIECHGVGWMHSDTINPHERDKAPNIRCYFCTNCPKCNGTGWIGVRPPPPPPPSSCCLVL